MILESLTPVEKSRGKYVALFDNGKKLNVTAVHIADYNLYRGRELSDEEYVDLRGSIELSAAKQRALRILGGRTMSADKMEKRLVQKGESGETAAETVRWLEEAGLVNDREYAEMIVSQYAKKGYGIAKIKDELYRRGISRELWEEALEGLDGTEDAALEVLEKKLRGVTDRDEIKRASAMLYRRGFTGGEVRAAVKRYLEGVEEDSVTWPEELD